ncbi:flavin-containing monooxygenase [Nocardia huaxiensis]|uniref:flavin-containing monooxygenase n=1 Tax=Nocardia huaxiensis TaxID=2755382 RepID=UPI001E581390|nr:NAD(P)/FAD-dependent oxidoreductase [Nocardia huaxiensis]UFS98533.1 NAD(P)/FAD-dependent oxidoreductase [Nocardia huaxiensis]
MTSPTPDHEVVIVGAGFSGIGVAIKLDQAGIRDFVLLEQESGVGGAWHSNTYPGVVVDVPSFAYSYSFEQSAEWSGVYAKGAELAQYARMCVDKYNLRRRLRLNTTVADAEFDAAQHIWNITLEGGELLTARFLVTATGVLTKPKLPDIAGISEFQGSIMHTARWDHSTDLIGKRVAIIGTGASSVSITPTIAPIVEHLTVFQRTPIWIMPKPDATLDGPARSILRHVPGALGALRGASNLLGECSYTLTTNFYRQLPQLPKLFEQLGRTTLRRQVHDPVIREKLTPTYAVGCKRIGFSNDYLPTFNRANVTLETSGIEAVTAHGIRTADGVEHEVDVLLLATGFKTFEPGNMPPFPIRGVDSTDLEAWWARHRYQAYQGLSVPGFPNLLIVNGPYGYNLSVYFQFVESQAKHIVRLLRGAHERRATLVDVTPHANARFWASMLRRRRNQIYFSGNCTGSNSYFFDPHGDVPIRAASTPETHWRAAHFDMNDYQWSSIRTPETVGAGQ